MALLRSKIQLEAAGHGVYWPWPQNNALCRCLTPPCDSPCPNQLQFNMGGIMALAADEGAVYLLDGQRLYRWAP